ncbi:hypothetical protein [Neptunicella sp.]|uniref:hypothetical protein n=1 Tax=Neptunicella sp. TaxID=2125986 RepID=UPI003F69355E
MKTHKLISILTLVLSAYTMNAYAHDPKEHAKEKEAPNCAVMQDIEQGKVDKSDPVIMAMMKKCHKTMDNKKADGKHVDKHMDGMKEEDDHHHDHKGNDDHNDDHH